MTDLSQQILLNFQVRKSKQQKEAFRTWLCNQLTALGYSPRVEGSRFSRNVVVGDPEKARVLFTAHYDTCAVLPVPNFITPRNFLWYLLYQMLFVLFFLAVAVGTEVGTMLLWRAATGTDCPMWLAMGAMYIALLLCIWWVVAGKANRHTVNDNTSGVLTLVEIAQALPPEMREQVCLVFFDNEEKGLFGSSVFAKAHRGAQKNALVVNFDCVSDGDHLHFFPSKAVKREEDVLSSLEQAFSGTGEKTCQVVRSFGFYPSDQAKFRRGVGVCALKKSPVFGYYMDRIHTKRDTVLMEENIHLLRDGAVVFAGRV